MTPEKHEDCAEWMKAQFAELGVDITVSTVPPVIRTAYVQDPFVCPHGTTLYHEPTSEQIAEWARDGVQ